MDKNDSARPPRTLSDKLLSKRILMLSEPVMPNSAKRIVSQLLYLDSEDPKKTIFFYLNTPGGSISDGFAIFDTIRFIRAPVTTICTGISASMGTILMLAPRKKEDRVAMANTRFMMHQPSSAYRGAASDIEIGAKQILKLRDRLVEIYVEETGQKADRIKTDINRDFWMTAEEAVDYGLCHRVVKEYGELA
ncbi:MAG: ClpP family protease [Planctomycetaceae bacterium]